MTVVVVISLLVAAAAVAAAWRQRTLRIHADQEHDEELARVRIEGGQEREAARRRAEAQFDRMIEGVIILDEENRIRTANRAAAALFNFDLPAAGRTLLQATRSHEIAALVSRIGEKGEVLGHEVRIDDVVAPRFLELNAVALNDASGAREGTMLVFHNITRLRQLEGARQEFVANVSHELRTPLSLIKSAAETLLDGGKNDPDTLGRFLDIIDRQANRLTLLINDLLLIARLDSGRVEMNFRAVPLACAVAEAAGDFLARARLRGMTLTQSVPDSIQVKADPERLRQVLANLLDNAVKYGRTNGNIAVVARMLGNSTVEVAVANDGPGIPKEAQARVFERFYRVDKARSREQGGTGLGLSIVKHVVQAHGGDVRVESTPGEGTTFWFTLPAAGSPAAAAPAAAT